MAKQPDSWHQHVISNVPPKMEAGPVTGLTPAPGPTSSQPVNVGFSALRPGFDVIELLPVTAQERLRLLRQHAADAHALVPQFEQIREASADRVSAEQRLRQLQASAGEGGFNMPSDYPGVVSQQKLVDKLTDELRRLQELQTLRTAAWHAASGVSAACEDFLRHGVPGNCQIAEIEIEPPKLLKDETVLDAVERLRRRVRELRADQHRIRSAPFPSAFAKQRAREQIEALAMQGAPSVSALIEIDGKIEFQTQRLTSEVHAEQRSLAFAQASDAVALICWLHKDALIAALDREISTESDDKAALSHEVRQKAEAEVQGDLLDIERQEAALVFAAWEQGLVCEHRSDCSPLAILQVRLITVPRAPNGPSSPSQAGYDLIGGGR